ALRAQQPAGLGPDPGARAAGPGTGPGAFPMSQTQSRSMLTDDDIYLFNEGSQFRLWEKLGARVVEGGTWFGVWAPNAESVAVIVWDLDHAWGDQEWMRGRRERNAATAPWSIYELHLGSWMRDEHAGNRSLSYQELATRLADYCEQLGFTHVEFLPVTEHPF